MLIALSLVACGGAPVEPATPRANVRAKPAAVVFGDAPPGEFSSKRFDLRLSLPDGRAWRIDDHSEPYLVASHPLAATELRALRFDLLSGEVLTREICWREAVARGVFEQPVQEASVEDTPSYDGTRDERLLLTVGAHGKDARLRFVSAGRRGCIALGIRSARVDGDSDETLAERMLLLRQRLLPRLRESDGVAPARSEPARERPPWMR